ncbi:MAG: hypothetical protein Q7R47_05000 [Candidatus Diapherotrites archaeon]|nr:hypothetical protein [Candidatus Diapherotrites archaeon]
MKYPLLLAGLLLCVVVLSGCLSQNGFDSDFAKAKAVMERNGAVVPDTLLPPSVDLINHTELELQALRLMVQKEGDSPDKTAMQNFLSGQLSLLEMQKQFYLAQEQLSLTDFVNVSCDPQRNLAKAVTHLDTAVTNAELSGQYFGLFSVNSKALAAKTQIDFDALLLRIQESRQLFIQMKTTAKKYCS